MASIIATPATFTSDPSAGTIEWASPANALTSNDTYTMASLAPLESTQRLRGVGASFAGIPAGSTIEGVEVLVEATGDTSSGGMFVFAEVSLVVGGAVTGANRGGAALEGGADLDTMYAFGGASDLWGLTPTLAQVQAADFGAVVRVAETGGGADAADVGVDHVQIRVHYREPVRASRMSTGLAIGIGL